MNAIVVVDKNYGIGKDNKLLVHLPGDLKYFKEKTLNKVVVMGRKTLESLPGGKPLPNRTNIVLSSVLQEIAEGSVVCGSKEELLGELAKYKEEDVFVMGGGRVYSELFDLCNRFYVTKIDEEFQCDTFFRNVDEEKDLEKVWESETEEYQGVKYKFTEYVRNGEM